VWAIVIATTMLALKQQSPLFRRTESLSMPGLSQCTAQRRGEALPAPG
jgi:hypothetical protein